MVHFCTKTPNFKSEYLKNAEVIAKILKVLTKFIKKVYKNLNILLKDAYADKICSKRTFVHCAGAQVPYALFGEFFPIG